MQKQDYESYYLRDFIYFALKGWRRIILFALIGAILFAGIATYRNRDLGKDEIIDGEVKPKAGVTLTDQELKAVNDYVSKNNIRVLRYSNRLTYLQNSANTLAERLSNSVYLSLDPDAQLVSSFDLVIRMQSVANESSEIIEQRHSLLSLEYLKSARSNAFFANLEKVRGFNINAINLRELVQVSMNDDKSIHFEISAPDMSVLQLLSEATQNHMVVEAENQIIYSYPHDVGFSDPLYETVKNPDIREARIQMENDLNQISNEIVAVTAEYDQVMDEVLEEEVEKAIEKKAIDLAEQEIINKSERAKVSLKLYAAGGLILGVLVALLWNIYRGSSSGKLLHSENFARRSGLLFINEIFVAEQENDGKKRIGSALDSQIDRFYLKEKFKNDVTFEEAVSYAVSVIGGLSEAEGKEDEQIVALAAEDRAVALVLDKLNQQAEQGEQKFALLPLSEGAGQVSIIESIKTADSVIIFVRPRKTELEDILRYLEMIQELRKPVLGLVSIEEIL